MHRRTRLCALAVLVLLSSPAPTLAGIATRPARGAGAEVVYEVRVIAPEHHWMEVEATFANLPDVPLELRMSRSSPGRYALHEFAKNLFQVRAYDEAGEPLQVVRPDPYGWTVPEHGDAVTVRYRIFGDRTDGTYLQVDTTHAHMNGPATFLWARGLERRPVRVRLHEPAGEDWTIATQLFSGDADNELTAPNLRYLMDSPIEFGETELRSFPVRDADGEQTVRVALHHQGSAEQAADYVDGVRSIVLEEAAVYGELPRFDGGIYTFIVDYLPWVNGDGMEHRNSTIITSSASLGQAGRRLLGTVSHEFFHCWNVERIRPATLEPFDFEHANMSSELWLAEGFTSYYGDLVLHRAGVTPLEQFLGGLTGTINAVRTSPGVRFRSAVDMSRLAPFVDAARTVDPTYWSNTFLSYYTFGDAIAVGLDLTLRDRSDGEVTLDDFMRAMWARFGRAEGVEPPTVPRPYTVDDARRVLAEISGDDDFASEFFARYIEGNAVIDYAPLLERAGLVMRPATDGAPWIGVSLGDGADGLTIVDPTSWGSPAYEAGLDVGDTLVSIDGQPLRNGAALGRRLAEHAEGDRVRVGVRRRDGSEEETTIVLGTSPTVEIVPIERTGGTLSDRQASFRQAWLGSQLR